MEIPGGDWERVDIGRMNLICAWDADGANRIDVERLVKVLDEWAEIAKAAEEHYRRSFEAHPERYDNSYAKYRAVNLALTVKEDLQCRYQKSLITSGAMDDIHSPRFFRNPDDVFYLRPPTQSPRHLLVLPCPPRCAWSTTRLSALS